MRLHFADKSDERGQYRALIEAGVLCTLGSYYYLKNTTVSREFGRLWEEQVRVHLVSWPQQEPQKQALKEEHQGNHLMSYADQKSERHYGEVWEEQDLRPRVIIDSGAFTAWSSGKPIRAEDYGEWALKFAVRWREKMASLHFINLDVIGDQIGTWRNQEKLEKMGLHPLPVVTCGADLKHLTHALERYDYICLGGLVPLSTQKKKMQAWLDHCFKEILRYWREHDDGEPGKLRKIHLLGVTQGWVLNRYPAYSTDSSAWTKPLRYGGGDRAGLKKRLPKYKDGDAEMAATLNALRAEIRYFKKMEEDATRLWTSRGISFADRVMAKT